MDELENGYGGRVGVGVLGAFMEADVSYRRQMVFGYVFFFFFGRDVLTVVNQNPVLGL